jgi:hypothetical protein
MSMGSVSTMRPSTMLTFSLPASMSAEKRASMSRYSATRLSAAAWRWRSSSSAADI